MPGGIWDWAGGLQDEIKSTKQAKAKPALFITILHLEFSCALFQNVVHTIKTKTQKVGRHPQTYTHLTSS